MELPIRTSKKEEFIDITKQVSDLIKIKDGFCILYCPHTTAGLTINEGADRSVKKDILSILKKIVPDDFPYQHLEGNSPAHVKASIMGSSLQILIKNNKLQLGTWQKIFFCEFDGPRNRKIYYEHSQ